MSKPGDDNNVSKQTGNPNLSTFSVDQLDEFSWRTICDWPLFTDIEVIRHGLDYAEIIRAFLWTKVPRAIRKKTNPERYRFEHDLLTTNPNIPSPTSQPSVNSSILTKVRRRLFARHMMEKKKNVNHDLHALEDQLGKLQLLDQRKIYIPRAHPGLTKIVGRLSANEYIALFAPETELDGFQRTIRIPECFGHYRPDPSFADVLYDAVIRGLEAQGINLIAVDKDRLKCEIDFVISWVAKIEDELRIVAPDALLMEADNYSPHIIYTLIARRDHIPSIMLQHGLDCDRYCYDQAYASAIALWGESRLQRYKQDSNWQPRLMAVTGNPEFDDLTLPDQINSDGDYWLWITRPHMPNKCYIPSRWCDEGVKILDTLLDSLSSNLGDRLLIKTHPYDYVEPYKKRIDEREMSDRVKISESRLIKLLPEAKLVFTEDSTGGLESMFFGKIIIHLHFTERKPVTPFADSGATFFADNSKSLNVTLAQTNSLSDDQRQSMLRARKRFIHDFAGPCDGRATDRLEALVYEILGQSEALERS